MTVDKCIAILVKERNQAKDEILNDLVYYNNRDVDCESQKNWQQHDK